MSSQRIFIEYKIAGVMTNAFNVQLGAADASFGVKKQDGTVVVPSATAVTNPSIGLYEYYVDVDYGVVYVASWRVINENGDQPIYVTQTFGPYYATVESPIKTVPDYRGTFIQSSTSTLFLSITDIHGNPIRAESLIVSIAKDGNKVVDNAQPDLIRSGFYTFDWTVPNDAEIGNYLVTWTYTAEGYTGTQLQTIVITASGDTENSLLQLYGSRLSDFRVALGEMICCAQKIPVFHEQALPDIDKKKFKFTFSKWNQAYGTRIYRNNKLIEDGCTINYFSGTVLFDTPLSSYDMVHADYNFRWFSDEQLDRFILNALALVNFAPPQGRFGIFNVPEIYVPIILYGAAKDAIRELLMCLQFQQPQQVFGGSEAAKSAFSNLETLKKNYEEEFKTMIDMKKYGKYPRSKAVVTPEYTLPGGRSRWFRYMFGSGV
jgi:hypothetical protein